jgi:hypothetical protein
MNALIDNAGYIYGTYAITFATLGAFAWRALRTGRQLGRQVDDDEKYWT